MIKPNWQVTIQAVENGFIVRVGCKLFVSDTWEKIAHELEAYFAGKETEFIKEHTKEFRGPQVTLGDGAVPEQDLSAQVARG